MSEDKKELLTPFSYDDLLPLTEPAPPTTEQLQQDVSYLKAQQLLQGMLDTGLISLSEYNKITLLNRQTFSPYLVEIMPKITG